FVCQRWRSTARQRGDGIALARLRRMGECIPVEFVPEASHMGTVWQVFWDGVSGDFREAPEAGALIRIFLRLLIAAVLGGLLGYDRERKGKEAGLRTHMLVGLGAALFMAAASIMTSSTTEQSRVMQGIVVGVGFLGAGAILKLEQEKRIEGLTTA